MARSAQDCQGVNEVYTLSYKPNLKPVLERGFLDSLKTKFQRELNHSRVHDPGPDLSESNGRVFNIRNIELRMVDCIEEIRAELHAGSLIRPARGEVLDNREVVIHLAGPADQSHRAGAEPSSIGNQG